MTDDTTIPGDLLPGVTVPPNWEYAYGYPEERQAEGFRYLAAWWDPHTDDAAYDDGRTNATAERRVFKDLTALLEQAGYGCVMKAAAWGAAFEELTALLDMAGFGSAQWGLGANGADAARVLLLDLVERTIRTAPLRATLIWLNRVAPPAPVVDLPGVDTVEGMNALLNAIQQGIDEFAQVKRAREGKTICPVCAGLRWRRADDWPAGGYLPCEVCEEGLVVDTLVARDLVVRDLMVGDPQVGDPEVTVARRAAWERLCEEEITERGGMTG
jgi:hypothetical protein